MNIYPLEENTGCFFTTNSEKKITINVRLNHAHVHRSKMCFQWERIAFNGWHFHERKISNILQGNTSFIAAKRFRTT